MYSYISHNFWVFSGFIALYMLVCIAYSGVLVHSEKKFKNAGKAGHVRKSFHG